MAKVYMVRHQHHGVITSHVFTEHPSEEQVAVLAAEAERIHGRQGRVTGWARVVEAELCGPSDLPKIDPPQGTPSTRTAPGGEAASGELVASGTGVISFPTKAED